MQHDTQEQLNPNLEQLQGDRNLVLSPELVFTMLCLYTFQLEAALPLMGK